MSPATVSVRQTRFGWQLRIYREDSGAISYSENGLPSRVACYEKLAWWEDREALIGRYPCMSVSSH